MPNQRNKDSVRKLEDKFSKSNSVIFAEYSGLDSNKLNILRKEIKNTGSELTIAKNTLIKRAMEAKKILNNIPREDLEGELSGQICVIFSYEDALSPIKPLVEFSKSNGLPKIKIGIIENSIVYLPEIEKLSALPSRNELLAQLIGELNLPLVKLIYALNDTQQKLVYVLSEIVKNKNN